MLKRKSPPTKARFAATSETTATAHQRSFLAPEGEHEPVLVDRRHGCISWRAGDSALVRASRQARRDALARRLRSNAAVAARAAATLSRANARDQRPSAPGLGMDGRGQTGRVAWTAAARRSPHNPPLAKRAWTSPLHSPELVGEATARLGRRPALLDAEIVSLNTHGRPDFAAVRALMHGPVATAGPMGRGVGAGSSSSISLHLEARSTRHSRTCSVARDSRTSGSPAQCV
jgi:hypothetical protein